MLIIGGEPSDMPYWPTNRQQAKERQQDYADAQNLAERIMAGYAGHNAKKSGIDNSVNSGAERITPYKTPPGVVRETRKEIRKTL